MGMLARKEVAFRMPKFRLETSLVLDKALQKMGIKTAYSSAADFGVISESGPLTLGTVKQKCYIDVTEKGTEAAAVTSAQIRLTSVSRPTRMTVDRPFLFFILDSQTNNILFIGKVVNL
jgi:serpin B